MKQKSGTGEGNCLLGREWNDTETEALNIGWSFSQGCHGRQALQEVMGKPDAVQGKTCVDEWDSCVTLGLLLL